MTLIKKLSLLTLLGAFGLFGSTFAVELNSTNITGAPFNCSINNTTCSLFNKSITSIASGAFINHSDLTYLYLSSNQITSIESGAFDGLFSLIYLDLASNQITSIESGAFDGLFNLELLNLYGNQITSIESGAFNGLSNLTNCYLGSNQITSIESGTFNGLSNLTNLSLYNNQITSIESGDFAGLSNLTNLSLYNNQITSIESGTFNGLSNLINLSLDGNPITSIESGDFAGLSNLTNLSLANNQITSIESGTFNGLSNLTNLSLYSNQITSIESGNFTGLSNLTNLDLASNQITSIESGDFAGLSNLTNLSLYNNQITSIESGTFNGLSNLIYLELASNCLNAEDTNLTNYLDLLFADYSTQLVCIQVNYTPPTTTSGPVTGSLVFTGPASYVTALESENPTMTLYDYVYTTNESHMYDYGSIVDSNNYLWTRNMGYPDNITGTVTWIALDITSPTATVSYSTTGATSGNVVATITLSETGTVTNNGGALSYTFTDNGSFVFEFVDEAGNTGSTTATVTWIDKTAPTATVTYSTTGTTNGNVVATITLSETGTVTNNGGLLSYTFTDNGSFVFEFVDEAGNTGSTTATVTWIDKTAPTATVTYSTTGTTNGNVVATITLSETGSVTNNGGLLSYTFTDNGSFVFEFVDEAGNTGNVTATVTWIDKVAPVITLSGSNPITLYIGDTYTDAGATWTDNVDGSGTLVGSGTVDTSIAGTYTITYTKTDIAGNTSTVNRTVTVENKPSSGGGGGSSVSKDDCPDGDYSSSYYDGTCGTAPNSDGDTNTGSDTQELSEQETAYTRAYGLGITTMYPIKNARLDDSITRVELAKMMSVYADKILKKTNVLDNERCEKYDDISSVNDELKGYISKACRLGIMGLSPDGKSPLSSFRPYDRVTRAEFGTVLSRVLYGDTYNNGDGQKYREEHLKILKDNNILKLIDPSIQELRGWILLMLYRSK